MEFHKYTISKKGFFRKSFEIHCDSRLVYTVSSKGFIAYKSLSFVNIDRQEVLIIKRPFNFGSYNFLFLENGKKVGELKKALISNKYTLESIYATYVADGNWLGNEYTVYLGDDDIAKVSRKMMTNKNQYGIAILDGNHNLHILAMVVIIEVVKIIRRKRSA